MKLVIADSEKQNSAERERARIEEREAYLRDQQEMRQLGDKNYSAETAANLSIRFVTHNPSHFRDLNGGTPDLEVQLDLAYAAILSFISRKEAERNAKYLSRIEELRKKMQSFSGNGVSFKNAEEILF